MSRQTVTSTLLTATLPALALVLAAQSSCILNDDFVLEEDTFYCEEDSDCVSSFRCSSSNTCIQEDTQEPCVDEDGDGYGSNEDRSQCENPELDFNDMCAECFPGAQETCDGLNNDGDMDVDEPVGCANDPVACTTLSIPISGAQWSCENGQCVLVPQNRGMAGCENVTIPCENGTLNTTQAMMNMCL